MVDVMYPFISFFGLLPNQIGCTPFLNTTKTRLTIYEFLTSLLNLSTKNKEGHNFKYLSKLWDAIFKIEISTTSDVVFTFIAENGED